MSGRRNCHPEPPWCRSVETTCRRCEETFEAEGSETVCPSCEEEIVGDDPRPLSYERRDR